MYRFLSLGLTALALVVFTGAAALADDQGNKDLNAGKTHEGKVVSVKKGELTMTMKGTNKEHTHKIAANAKILCDGKECKLEDLKPGERVRVTTKKGDQTTAIRVEALNKNKTFQPSTNPGK